MEKSKILIIDDRWNERSKTYLRVLSDDFNTEAVESASTLYDKIDDTSIDAYLVDIVLSNWLGSKSKPLEVLDVLERIGTEKPIILVSNAYSHLVEDDKLTQLFNEIIDKGYRVNNFLLWDDFTKVGEVPDPNSLKLFLTPLNSQLNAMRS